MAKTPTKAAAKKTVINKVPAQARPINRVAVEEGISKLEAAINPDNNKAPTVEEIETDILEENKTDETAILRDDEPEAKTELPNTDNVEKVKDTLSIWDDLKSSTEEDKNIKAVTNAALSVEEIEANEAKENALSNLASQANGSDIVDDENARKQGNLVKAGIIVELIDVGFMLLCIFITWDFSDENQRRYTLVKERKKAIQTNIYKLLELSGKKPNPKKDIWFLVLGSYAPLLFVAVLTMIKNFKEKSEAKKREKMISQMKLEENNALEKQKAIIDQQRFENAELLKELEANKKPGSQIKATTSKPFKEIPKIGKTKIDRKPYTKRGVQPGQKRAPYKKRKV